MKSYRRKFAFFSALVLWVFLVCSGVFFLLKYNSTPGYAGTAPKAWPTSSSLHRNTSIPTLVLFLHPKCPCSTATVNELSVLLARAQNPISLYAVFVQPENWTKAEVQGSLWRKAKKIPGLQVFLDKDLTETKNFGIQTSGNVLAYDERGHLRFHGGITPSRGHEGENEGVDALTSFINTGSTSVEFTKVFGCSLFSRSEK